MPLGTSNNNKAGSLRMPSVPQFAAAAAAAALPATALTVLAAETEASTAAVAGSAHCGWADVSEAQYMHAHEFAGSVVRVLPHRGVPAGSVALPHTLRLSNRVCDGADADFTPFDAGSEAGLARVVCEVAPRWRTGTGWSVDGVGIAAAAARHAFGCVLTAEADVLAIAHEGDEWVLRVAEVAHARHGDGGDDAGAGADEYRGVVGASTSFYVRPCPSLAAGALVLRGAAAVPTTPPPTDLVQVDTSDDELFLVRRGLLAPCIALASTVLKGLGKYKADGAGGSGSGCAVAVDCCTFDRVLLYLEATAAGRAFKFAAEHTDGLSAAADFLGLRGLRDDCDERRGRFHERVRKTPIRFAEVLARNARRKTGSDDAVLLMDGAVYDITRWLPEHPGGSTIIPEQALDVDATVFFELYHVSRQSFVFLREFYEGELDARDHHLVPPPGGGQVPSPGFLDQLRAHTSWRVPQAAGGEVVHKSF